MSTNADITLRKAVCEELTRHGVEFDHDDIRSAETGLNASEELVEDLITAVRGHLVAAIQSASPNPTIYHPTLQFTMDPAMPDFRKWLTATLATEETE